VFVALTGEEQNQLGAEYFVESTPFYTEPNAVINLDMIGHLDSNQKRDFLFKELILPQDGVMY
jgi:Predicted aminopeptidases